MPQMTEDERSVIFLLTYAERIFFIAGFACAAIWGTAMKAFLYYNIMQEKISERPINVLILLDQVIEHVINVIMAVGTSIKVSFYRKTGGSRGLKKE